MSGVVTNRDGILIGGAGSSGGGGGSLISGTVDVFANLPSPASDYTGQIYYVMESSQGFLSAVGIYKYPKGLYSPNVSNIWEQIPLNVKISEDTFTLVNITNWSEFYGYAFDISVGDRIIYNGTEYKNLTGSQTTTAPDTDTTNWEAIPLHNVINVAKSGGDFTSVKSAIDSITDNSSTNRYVVRVAPGIYTESNPIQGKEYVVVKAIGDLQTTRIVAGNGSADLFTMANFFLLEGLTLWGVTGASNYAVNQTVAGLTSLFRCAVAECSNGIHINHASANMSLTGVGVYNLTATTARSVYQESGVLSFSIFTAAPGNITTLIEITGSGSITRINNLSSEISTVGTGILIKDQARVDIGSLDLGNMTDGLVCEGGASVRVNAGYIHDATNDGVRINDVGTATELTVQSITIEDSARYDFNLLSATCIVSGSGKTSIDKLKFVPGVSMYGIVIDLKEDDEGTNIFGELHVGIPEIGYESVFGEGDSYTRGMLVYTETSGGVFTDVSVAARSASGSTFTFPGVAAGNAIYVASSLSSATDVLDHFGIKTKVNTACVVGSGEIVIEYWNGSTWTELNGMEVDSEGSYFPHAKNYFQNTGRHHIRYNSDLVTDSWTKNDPITPAIGTDYYWVRFRIATAITTAPIFEQFKLHTNRYEINSDGWIEYFGKARPIGQLPLNFTTAKPFEGNMQNQTIYVSENIGVGFQANKFTAQADKTGISGNLPYDLDTSSPIKFAWSGRPDTTETITWTVRWAWVKDGDTYSTTEPAAITNSRSSTYGRAVTAGLVSTFIIDIDVSEMISRRDGAFGDQLWISIQPSTMTGTFSLTTSGLNYTKWCEGGHI